MQASLKVESSISLNFVYLATTRIRNEEEHCWRLYCIAYHDTSMLRTFLLALWRSKLTQHGLTEDLLLNYNLQALTMFRNTFMYKL